MTDINNLEFDFLISIRIDGEDIDARIVPPDEYLEYEIYELNNTRRFAETDVEKRIVADLTQQLESLLKELNE